MMNRIDDEEAAAHEQQQNTTDEEAPTVAPLTANTVPTAVDVHPLVLLSVVDHFTRINAKTVSSRRVAGLLLGTVLKVDDEPHLDITTCFAVPFDEDAKDPDVWFLDTNYADDMWHMHKKVLPQIKVVGWYSSGPTISSNDLNIHLQIAERFCPNPVYCIVNADPAKKGVPVLTYMTTEARGAKSVEFRNIVSSLGTIDAEEIGIEHLLRDLTDTTITTLSSKVGDRHLALLRLEQLLGVVEEYLRDVSSGVLPICTEILNGLQELVNWMPRVHRMKTEPGMMVATNDQALTTFIASVSRCVTAMYDVIVNRRVLRRETAKRAEAAKKKEEEEDDERKKKKEAAADKKREASVAPADEKTPSKK